jgi:hypothetical protein
MKKKMKKLIALSIAATLSISRFARSETPVQISDGTAAPMVFTI